MFLDQADDGVVTLPVAVVVHRNAIPLLCLKKETLELKVWLSARLLMLLYEHFIYMIFIYLYWN